ncbi:hypothetical protein JAO73_17950 [Hymenobacter sp. BT523]|uniref:hypothetical protein n=1 Tax=Hymenobacter sp. BT523 TaxID=2795725 RepID=UPI0018ED39D3|nr:hypothetical protein [Hymenobacter sp. BT523]MBJ6110910.1 hypothetical protein [Hymenobacter sp. BT523]
MFALALSSFSACQRNDDVAPVSEVGEWRLTVSGGGTTGKMEALPPTQDTRLVLEADRHYVRYYNGLLLERNTYELRTVQRSPDGPAEKVLFMKSTNSPDGQAFEHQEIITSLTATNMELTTGGGCAINGVYERVPSGTAVCGVNP